MSAILEDGKVPQQRDYADDDDYGAYDLFGPAIDRQQVSAIMMVREFPMQESPSLIMVQFLAWIADRPRTREQAVEAWHSCPHISVWEDAVVDGLVHTVNDGRRTIALTSRGRAILKRAQAETV